MHAVLFHGKLVDSHSPDVTNWRNYFTRRHTCMLYVGQCKSSSGQTGVSIGVVIKNRIQLYTVFVITRPRHTQTCDAFFFVAVMITWTADGRLVMRTNHRRNVYKCVNCLVFISYHNYGVFWAAGLCLALYNIVHPSTATLISSTIDESHEYILILKWVICYVLNAVITYLVFLAGLACVLVCRSPIQMVWISVNLL